MRIFACLHSVPALCFSFSGEIWENILISQSLDPSFYFKLSSSLCTPKVWEWSCPGPQFNLGESHTQADLRNQNIGNTTSPGTELQIIAGAELDQIVIKHDLSTANVLETRSLLGSILTFQSPAVDRTSTNSSSGWLGNPLLLSRWQTQLKHICSFLGR